MPISKKNLEGIIEQIQDLYIMTKEGQKADANGMTPTDHSRNEQIDILKGFFEEFDSEVMEYMITSNEKVYGYPANQAQINNPDKPDYAAAIGQGLTFLIIPEMNRGVSKTELRDLMVNQLIEDLTVLNEAADIVPKKKAEMAEGKKRVDMFRAKSAEIQKFMNISSKQLQVLAIKHNVTGNDVLEMSLDDVVAKLRGDNEEPMAA